jgi:hypothetical protein
MSARRVSQILGTDSALSDLAAASRRVEQLQRIYLETVPAPLQAASQVGSAHGGVLSILAHNSAVAAMLRQLSPRILARFERHGVQFTSMRIRVQVDAPLNGMGARSAKSLSPEALRTIEGAVRELPQSPLREALQLLAKHRGPGQSR